MKAIIPAAGYGTRLFPLTVNKPKTLLMVRNKPIIQYILEQILIIKEIDNIYIVTNNKFYAQFVEWKQTYACKIPITIVNDGTNTDEEKLGQWGDIYFLMKKEQIDDDILIVNSDNLFNFNLGNFYSFFKEKGNSIGLYDLKNSQKILKELRNQKHWIPLLDNEKKIVKIIENPISHPTTLYTRGIYMFTKGTYKYLKEYFENKYDGITKGHFVPWLHKKAPLYGFNFNQPNYFFFDIGTIESYQDAQLFDK